MSKKALFGVCAPLINPEMSFDERLQDAKTQNLSMTNDVVLFVCEDDDICTFTKRKSLESVFGAILPNIDDERSYFLMCKGSCYNCGLFSDEPFVAEVVYY
jgi:hypothetical protein